MDAIDRFAAEAAAFQQWALGDDTGPTAARAALLHITRLYSAALDLPSTWMEESADDDAQSVGQDEWRMVFVAAGRLPLVYYGVVFDPSIVPPEQPVVGSLADDIADIYRDTVSGLRKFQAGHRDAANWEWRYLLRIHWGDHAARAIRALHAWLAANDPDRLSAEA